LGKAVGGRASNCIDHHPRYNSFGGDGIYDENVLIRSYTAAVLAFLSNLHRASSTFERFSAAQTHTCACPQAVEPHRASSRRQFARKGHCSFTRQDASAGKGGIKRERRRSVSSKGRRREEQSSGLLPQPTAQPTNSAVLHDFRVFWQSPHVCKSSYKRGCQEKILPAPPCGIQW